MMLRWPAAFARFWYQFIVGDDWVLAACVAGGLAAVYVLHRTGAEAWWLLPIVAVVALSSSLRRVRRQGG